MFAVAYFSWLTGLAGLGPLQLCEPTISWNLLDVLNLYFPFTFETYKPIFCFQHFNDKLHCFPSSSSSLKCQNFTIHWNNIFLKPERNVCFPLQRWVSLVPWWLLLHSRCYQVWTHCYQVLILRDVLNQNSFGTFSSPMKQ